jgi:hypothetical protein
VQRDLHRVHDEVECELSVFSGSEGKYIQLDTFGRSTREFPRKVSQTIQFDRGASDHLLRIIESTFGAELRH